MDPSPVFEDGQNGVPSHRGVLTSCPPFRCPDPSLGVEQVPPRPSADGSSEVCVHLQSQHGDVKDSANKIICVVRREPVNINASLSIVTQLLQVCISFCPNMSLCMLQI